MKAASMHAACLLLPLKSFSSVCVSLSKEMATRNILAKFLKFTAGVTRKQFEKWRIIMYILRVYLLYN